MSEIIVIPTVEQINLEHQLANSKANEAVQHATNCGLMLLQVKASLSHGEWLPWLQGTIDRKELKVGLRQSRKYMQLASNMHCEAHLLEAPSINAALELLSDKEPTEQHCELIDGETERQARITAEQQAESERAARLLAEQDKATEQRRNREWMEQNKANRDKIRALELDLSAALDRPVPKPEIQVIEKIPADYEAFKACALELAKEIDDIKKQQSVLVADQVKAKLKGYQGELDELEAKKRNLERQAKEYQDYLASLTGTAKQMEAQARAIEKSRQALVDLASEIADFQPVDKDLTRKALALADMHKAAAESLFLVFGSKSYQPILFEATA